jgi:hypothetical protein
VVLVGLGILEGDDDAFGRVAGCRLLLCHFGWALSGGLEGKSSKSRSFGSQE